MEVVQYTVLLFIIHSCVEVPQMGVVGVSDAGDAAFPNLVHIEYQQSIICSASIMSSTKILTAAHCVGSLMTNISKISVVNLYTDQRYNVEKSIIHPDYSLVSADNDIALLKLTQNISFNDKVQPAKLPEQDTPAGSQLTIAGLGYTKAINLTSISNAECSLYYPVSSSSLCAKSDPDKRLRLEDTGSPLMDGLIQVGVKSYVLSSILDTPAVFARVYSYKDWIVKTADEI